MASVSIKNDSLVFCFPEVHEKAKFQLSFQRTLRIPDDDKEHPLPPGLGEFPLRNVDDHPNRLPAKWAERGGIMLPMYQSEALWLMFGGSYPCAVKVATGRVCCLTGEQVKEGLERDPQNYVVVPEQPWLDGYNVGDDVIRQFVAAPIDHEASVEKQITGKATEGGMQIEVVPMTAAAWEKHKREFGGAMELDAAPMVMACAEPEMGFAAGGKMRQEIYDDPYEPDEWSDTSAACNIWVCNSLAWRVVTGEAPPTVPLGPAEYGKAGFPWFDYYDDRQKLKGSKALAGLKSYKGGQESVEFTPEWIVEYRRQRDMKRLDVRIREGRLN